MKQHLTDKIVLAAKPKAGGGQQLIWCDDPKGFGLLVSGTTKTFVFQKKNKRKKIGRYPGWTLAKARKQAHGLVAALDSPKEPESLNLTLQAALDRYLEGMRRRKSSQRSIDHLQATVQRYLKDWLPDQITDITRKMVDDRHSKVGTDNGPIAANAAMRGLRCIWNDAMLIDETMPQSPTVVLRRRWNAEDRKRKPIEDYAGWAAKVAALPNQTRRNLQWVMLLTGLRRTDACTMKWTDLDFTKGTLHRPKPKGGEKRAFTVPLSRLTIAILRNQRKHAHIIREGSPWVFPARNRKGKWHHVTEPKEPKAGLPSPHRLRDSYHSILVECEVHPYTLEVLTAHRSAGQSVTAGYVRQPLETLRVAQEKATALIRAKVKAGRKVDNGAGTLK